MTIAASFSPVVKYHRLARRHLMPSGFLMRPLLNGGSWAGDVATYTTLFSATLRELEERFPNVGDPLSVPRVEQRTNPFTKLPIQVQVFKPQFGPPRHRRSLFASDGPSPIKPVFVQPDDYGRYLRSLVPALLQSLPHIGTKNVSLSEAEDLLELGAVHPAKFVECLPGEGVVEVASLQLVELIRTHPLEDLQQRFPDAAQEVPLEWFAALLRPEPTSDRLLCAWLRV